MRYLIDPSSITDYSRSVNDLQAFWLFCMLVAGKIAYIQAKKLANFLRYADILDLSPFKYIELRQYKFLEDDLRAEGLGQYTRIKRCFIESLSLDLQTCTVTDLEKIYGVGPKTARLFLLHSRPDQEFAAIDTHILKWMRDELGLSVPKNTPSNPILYRKLEEHYLKYCTDNSLSPADFDLQIWNSRSRKELQPA